jgi:fused signal recognition particle receptor
LFLFRKPKQREVEPEVEETWEWPLGEPTVEPAAEASAVERAAVEPTAEPSAVEPSAQPVAPAVPEPDETPGDLSEGLQKSRGGFMSRLRGLLKSGPAAADWDSVEEMLIAGDVGGALAGEVVERARARKDAPSAEAAVREELAALLIPSDPRWRPVPAAPDQPAVLLMVGVNGTGKTTTIGKLAHRYRAEGSTVLLAAADTFRAAAIDQLRIWSDRSGCQFVSHVPGADPAAVVYDAIDAAVARHVDIVIADTAGRLHTKSNLMDELAKMRRVIDRRLPGAAPEVLFVLDATTGQNGLAQARVFHETVGLTGIVLTKLDSTAKGGIVFAIEDALHVPVRFVGVGEKLGDLLPFDPAAFVSALFA